MDKKKRIEQEVEETLAVMDRLDRLEAGPYFYTRVQARMRSRDKEKTGIIPGPGWWSILKPVMMTLLLLVNLVSAAFFLMGPSDTATARNTSGNSPLYTYVSGVTEEYWNQNQSIDSYIADGLTTGESQ